MIIKRSKIDRLEAKEIADKVQRDREEVIEVKKTRVLNEIETIARIGHYRLEMVAEHVDEITKFLVNRNFLTYGTKGSNKILVIWD